MLQEGIGFPSAPDSPGPEGGSEERWGSKLTAAPVSTRNCCFVLSSCKKIRPPRLFTSRRFTSSACQEQPGRHFFAFLPQEAWYQQGSPPLPRGSGVCALTLFWRLGNQRRSAPLRSVERGRLSMAAEHGR